MSSKHKWMNRPDNKSAWTASTSTSLCFKCGHPDHKWGDCSGHLRSTFVTAPRSSNAYTPFLLKLYVSNRPMLLLLLTSMVLLWPANIMLYSKVLNLGLIYLIWLSLLRYLMDLHKWCRSTLTCTNQSQRLLMTWLCDANGVDMTVWC